MSIANRLISRPAAANIKKSKVFTFKDYYKQYTKLNFWIIQCKHYFAFIKPAIPKGKKIIFIIGYF